MAQAWSSLSCEIEAGRTLSSRLSYIEKEKIEIKSFVFFQVVGKPKMHVDVYNVIHTAFDSLSHFSTPHPCCLAENTEDPP